MRMAVELSTPTGPDLIFNPQKIANAATWELPSADELVMQHFWCCIFSQTVHYVASDISFCVVNLSMMSTYLDMTTAPHQREKIDYFILVIIQWLMSFQGTTHSQPNVYINMTRETKVL